MKKTLTLLIVCFSLMVWPPRAGQAQSDSVAITKKDVQILHKKDSIISNKIPNQLEKANKLIDEIVNTTPERVIKFRTVVKRRVRTDSFYVLVDTCLSKTQLIAYPVHDTIFLQPAAKDNFFKRLFGKKEQRKDEMKVIQ